eukprot:COSAG01_NODE_369_length_18046_cov_130.301443_18_plen_612_part_00
MVTSLVTSVFAGSTAVYTAINWRSFGIKVQGMSWGFMATAMVGSLYAKQLRQSWPMLIPLMAWIIFGISIAQGWLIGLISMSQEVFVNIVFTSLAGAFVALLVVASLGYEFTQGLSLQDLGSGHGGCDSTSCYVTVVFTMAWAVLGMYNQVLFRDTHKLTDVENLGCYKRILKKVWIFIATFCQPIFIMDTTLVTMGTDGKSAEEINESMLRFKDALAKLLTFCGHWILFGCTMTLVVSTLELFTLGIYTRTVPMTLFGLAMLVVCALLLVTLFLGITAHKLPATSTFKNFRTRLFVLFGFICSPTVALASLVCFTLADHTYLRLPWVMELVGLEDIHAALADGSMADGVSDLISNDDTMDSLVSTLRSDSCGRTNCTMPVSIAMEEILYEMPTAAYTLLGISIGLVLVIILTCRALGGWYFLADQVSAFCAILNFVNGLAVALVGFFMYEDTVRDMDTPDDKASAMAAAQSLQSEGKKSKLVHILAAAALWMTAVSVVGLVGHKAPVAKLRKLLMHVYLLLLLITLLAFSIIFCACFYFAANAEPLTNEYWDDPIFQQELNKTVAREITKEEFVNAVGASYNLVSLLAATLTSYILIGVFATYCESGSIF